LRDFDDRAGNFDRIRKILEGDVDKIWSEIYKPEKFENSKCTDFFNFEYSMLPHKIYQEEKFYEKTRELKSRFVVGAENSLFLSDSEEKNVPMDGLTFFIDQAWETIRH
jgi:protein SEY1